MVSFLSRTMGRVRGVAAGSRKTKSRFGSTLEKLSHIRIWFFEREARDLVRRPMTKGVSLMVRAGECQNVLERQSLVIASMDEIAEEISEHLFG